MKLILPFYFLVFAGFCFSQSEQFNKTYDHHMSDMSVSPETSDLFLVGDGGFVRLDSIGDLLYSKQWDPSGSEFRFRKMEVFSDTSFLAVGERLDGSLDIGIISEIDTSGDVLWTKTFMNNQGVGSIRALEKMNNSLFAFAKETNGGLLIGIIENQQFSTYRFNLPISDVRGIQRLNDTTFTVIATGLYTFSTSGNFISGKYSDDLMIFDVEPFNNGYLLLSQQSIPNYEVFLIETDSLFNFEAEHKIMTFEAQTIAQQFFSNRILQLDTARFSVVLGNGFYSGSYVIDVDFDKDTSYLASPLNNVIEMVRKNNGKLSIFGNGPIYGIKSIETDEFNILGFDSLNVINECYSPVVKYAIETLNNPYVFGNQTCSMIGQENLMDINLSMTSYNSIYRGMCVDVISGIQTSDKKLGFVYPNPNNGRFSIQNIAVEEVFEIQMLDMGGRMIDFEQTLFEDEISFKTENLNKGFYLMRIHFKDGSNAELKITVTN